MRDNNEMPGHLARRFQQIAVAVFLAEVEEAGFDLTPAILAALPAQLGLRLEARKDAVDTLAIDYADKVPSGN